LLLVGNDLVDLTDEETRPEQRHPRFDQRVFCQQELAWVDHSPDPNRTRWALWALKESAYKVAKKLDPGAIFAPRQLAVEGKRDGVYAIQNRAYRFFAALIQSSAWVHALTVYSTRASAHTNPPTLRIERREDFGHILWLEGEKEQSAYAAVRAVPAGSEARLSVEVRILAREVTARVLGVDASRIDVTKHNRIPRLQLDGADFGGDLSFSHHGNFVAFSWCARPLQPAF
jgi:phosphopantetheinyl transferase (holo-ACP synthase)